VPATLIAYAKLTTSFAFINKGFVESFSADDNSMELLHQPLIILYSCHPFNLQGNSKVGFHEAFAMKLCE